MSTKPKRLSASEKQRMLVQYLRDGTVPEGFYVHEQKNGIIQFRHVRQPKPNNIKDPIRANEAKIKLYKQKIAELESANAHYKSTVKPKYDYQVSSPEFKNYGPHKSSDLDYEEDIFD